MSDIEHQKTKHVHLISDATGETVSAVMRACLVQYDGIDVEIHRWWLVRTEAQIRRVVDGIQDMPGTVIFTLVDPTVRGILEETCRTLGLSAVPILDPVMRVLSDTFESDGHALPGKQHALDEDYFSRIDAMQFSMAHDDGQLLHGLEQADVVIVGVSRTSKTPTCMYLANRGIKAANIPLVAGIDPPNELFSLKKPLVIGLTRDPKSLSDIRRSRLRIMREDQNTSYTDEDLVRQEVAQARRLYGKMKWPVIDVTRRSIEEVAATIMQKLGFTK
ncbi:MAG: pyruvate, water dikinase regulatory protein [Rhodospirillaceae bacterium]